MLVIEEEVLQTDLQEARGYLSGEEESAHTAFAVRQLRARKRLTLMFAFYRRNHCRLARLHLLAGCAIVLGRFAGFSKSFDELADAFMPVDAAGQPLSAEWDTYMKACAARLPVDARDELWIAAHMKDLEKIRAARLDRAFDEEFAAHKDDPTWRLLKQHMDVTVGVRLMDYAALTGAVAYETAFGGSLVLTVRQLFTAGWQLLGRYAKETARALLTFDQRAPGDLVSYRCAALELIRYSLTSWTASRVFRRGVRARERGSVASEEGWNLLEGVLGERANEVHPTILAFYKNPSGYAVKASLELKTGLAKFWSRLATLVIGQGLYEHDLGEINARFRVFRRGDGSMHFVRELYCGEAMRVFDSDFIIREMNGKPALFEVFVDLQVDVEMKVEPLVGAGLSICGRNIYWRGIRLPAPGLQVEFQSHVVTVEGREQLQIDGHLTMQPRTRFGRFFAYKILRRPEQLACIHYTATTINTSDSRFSDV